MCFCTHRAEGIIHLEWGGAPGNSKLDIPSNPEHLVGRNMLAAKNHLSFLRASAHSRRFKGELHFKGLKKRQYI